MTKFFWSLRSDLISVAALLLAGNFFVYVPVVLFHENSDFLHIPFPSALWLLVSLVIISVSALVFFHSRLSSRKAELLAAGLAGLALSCWVNSAFLKSGEWSCC
jgi:hypothetical protein